MKFTKGPEEIEGALRIEPIRIQMNERDFDILLLALKRLYAQFPKEDCYLEMIIEFHNFKRETAPKELPF